MGSSNYETVGAWADVLKRSVSDGPRDPVVDSLLEYDVSTSNGIKELAAYGIAQLHNNLVPASQTAITLWQYTQCLKKFRYGCTAQEREMFEGWVQRNAACGKPYEGPEWVLAAVREKLAPLGPAFDSVECDGGFGNGAVYEGLTVLARWNSLHTFAYAPRCPDSLPCWRDSSCLACRLSAVPKDMFKLRSITVEPAEATFLQQYYRTRLIAAAAQVLPRNSAIPAQVYGGGPEIQRRRCVEGSLTGRTATIDLSDASDSIRWDVVSYVFPANIVAALERARSPYCEVAGVRHAVHMFAGMGNATTFIVETLFFWALCSVLSAWVRDLTPCSVFGDDIVIGTRAANHPLFLEQLALAGLKVNMEKSGTSDGPGFREACGLCAYQGIELPLLRVRGYRCDQPEELVSLCDFVNVALAPDSRYAPFVRRAALEVGSRLVDEFHLPVLPVPLVRSGAYLVDSSETIGDWSYRARWDPHSQHPFVRVRCLKRIGGKTLTTKDVTDGEALGILNGQLRTMFRDAPIGFSSNKTRIPCPSKRDKVTLAPSWVCAWGSDASLVELVQD